MRTRPRRSYQKRRSPKMWLKRRTLQPPSIHIINQELQGRSGGFWRGLGTISEQREAKNQYKKFRKNQKQYIIREFQNPEDIIVLVRYLKDPTTILNTSITTAISAQYKKDPIMAMIQTEEIKQFFKKCQSYGKT